MRISDWSSDVCSSDLLAVADRRHAADGKAGLGAHKVGVGALQPFAEQAPDRLLVDPVGAARHHQHGAARLAGAEDERLGDLRHRSEEHTSELQSLMRISYAVFCLKKNNTQQSK